MQTRHAVVTGAASGIGAAVLSVLKAEGAHVTSLDLRDAPGADASLVVDLSDPASIDAVVSRLSDVDLLINVAGVPGTFPDDKVFAVNFLGLRHLTDALLPRISDGGAVVNVASNSGHAFSQRLPLLRTLLETKGFADGAIWFREHKPDDVAAYAFSKEAVLAYSQAAARREWSRGVRVNAVSPGPVETPILVDFEESMGKEVLDSTKVMVGRHGTPEDIAPLVTFLASPAAGWVNGENLIADGGLIALVRSS